MEKKIIITEEEKSRILNLHENATKNQYLNSIIKEEENPKDEVIITPKDKEKIGNFLYNKIMEKPELHYELGIDKGESKLNVLDKLSELKIDLDDGYVHFDLPSLGVVTPSFGFSFGGNNLDIPTEPLSSLEPSTVFDATVTITLGDLFHKK